ncbi:MAG: kinase [Acidimicrobiia bacterium]|jgi:NAD+ kinase|nr:kinase [Acidimicrobiia bacterium]
MGKVLLVVHQHRKEALHLALDALQWLTENGHQVWLPAEDAGLLDRVHLGLATPASHRFDLAVSIGGDGTMLRTVNMVAALDVPVLGIHVGQLGYLVEVEPPAYRDAIEAFFAGKHCIEERMRLAVEVEGSGIVGAALNEAVVEKTPMGHTVRLRVAVDGEHFTTYTTDGLIVATPTGSTAYALSARAPIVAPGHRALVLTPVAPHHLFDRTVVLQPDSHVRLEVASYRPAELFIDGQNLATLDEGMAVRCTASLHPARLVTFAPRNFLRILKTKFGLNDH